MTNPPTSRGFVRVFRRKASHFQEGLGQGREFLGLKKNFQSMWGVLTPKTPPGFVTDPVKTKIKKK